MAKDSPWPTILAERAALAADLEAVAPERWSTPSQCEGWTVRETLAHLTALERQSPLRFFAGLAGSGFRFTKMANKQVADNLGSLPADTLAGFKAHIADTTAPPGPVDSWLGETIVHAEDIRRPLGIAHTYPADAVTRIGDFYSTSNLLIGAKNRIAGLTLRATDADWTIGSGPEVSGPALSLVLAMTGRTSAIAELSGDGVATLSSRR
ncbi:MAG: maleylpyruvate isomerase family mycothiol-dependent enzyme [Acidobacteria bacterium]|nr:maleylpyruvate isomerase family mycothiol-dependent enzyme [Acidobacteriota bacterium]